MSDVQKPVAGWYPTQTGQRWWDGHEWGQHAPPAPQVVFQRALKDAGVA